MIQDPTVKPILYTAIFMKDGLVSNKYSVFKDEVIHFFQNFAEGTEPVWSDPLSDFKPKTNLVTDFKNGMLMILNENDHNVPNGLFTEIFGFGKDSETDGLQFPPEAMKIFTEGVDIYLSIHLPSFPFPDKNYNCFFKDLKPLFKHAFAYPFSFTINLFGDKVPARVSVSELQSETHSGVILDKSWPGFGSINVHLLFKAKIRVVTCPVIPSVEVIHEKFEQSDNCVHFLPSYDMSYAALSWMYALIFHRNEFKVFKYLSIGYLLFPVSLYKKNRNVVHQMVIEQLIGGFMRSKLPSYPSAGGPAMEERLIDGSNSKLPALMDGVKTFIMKGNVPFDFKMPENQKPYAKFGNPGWGGHQNPYVTVGFTDDPKKDFGTSEDIKSYLEDLKTFREALEPFLECITKTEELLKQLTNTSGTLPTDPIEFFAAKISEDVMVNPTEYITNEEINELKYTIKQDTMQCISEVSKKIIGS